jgi:hypothetical protein
MLLATTTVYVYRFRARYNSWHTRLQGLYLFILFFNKGMLRLTYHACFPTRSYIRFQSLDIKSGANS